MLQAVLSEFHFSTEALMPKNILSPTLATKLAVDSKLAQRSVWDLARNSSISRTPMLCLGCMCVGRMHACMHGWMAVCEKLMRVKMYVDCDAEMWKRHATYTNERPKAHPPVQTYIHTTEQSRQNDHKIPRKIVKPMTTCLPNANFKINTNVNANTDPPIRQPSPKQTKPDHRQKIKKMRNK